jgi:ornithine cyclodeaminase/alanine dehydrogenase-like protein (mu-crystallin family)
MTAPLLRTAAVSALAVRRLAQPDARRLLVFGRGPQAHAHAARRRRCNGRIPRHAGRSRTSTKR